MRKVILLRVIFFVSLGSLSINLNAQNVFQYEPPERRVAVPPEYPAKALRNSIEGYVVYNFMISKEGRVFDPVVVESTDSIFEASTMKALEGLRYKPAMLNGEPVDTSQLYKFSFRVNDGVMPERWFFKVERDFHKAIEEGDLAEAQQIFNDLRDRSEGSFFAAARVNFDGYFLAKARGDVDAQRYFLERSLAYDRARDRGEPSVLQQESLPTARAELFKVQILAKHYGDAIQTFLWMQRENDEEFVNLLRPAYDKLRAMSRDDTTYAITGELGSSGGWSIALHKRGFYFDQIDGRIDEIKMHCRAKYVIFTEIEETRHAIPGSWGDCKLYLVGDPDTSFRFVQTQPE